MTIITSKANNLIKNTKKLLQKKHRKASYLIEGWHLFEEARQAGAVFRHVFVLEEMAERVGDLDCVVLVSAEVLKELTDAKTPQGIVAEVALSEEVLPEKFDGKYLILEDVQDPGNVGTMIRTADAAGFDGVFLSKKSADIYNDKTLRSMQGSHFHLPIWRVDVLELLGRFQAAGHPVLATTLSKTSVDYKSLANYDSFALVMGNEGQGISAEMASQADQLVHISMPGQAESLNVAVAAGILMFSLL
ncbi:TrmH family RNA methyltransferase [Streptococcus loxodontisalivarius]|uniref:TrmH family RNA methyltransferase n=1 Tax=Streptococcus loxodontisalivarius TaxID=1349415 RepID=A0ABS2PQN2_9STRE|nr:RNA methyltransferase [Streptococcus loxodontisalivarius]MBM7642361.1 TrmH family RNA methyltransferase [Streptococcus loxodontisalivarius]